MDAQPDLHRIEVSGSTRAAFLVRATLASGAVFGAAAAGPFARRALGQAGVSDVDILNYALTLEYVESRFYERALDQVPDMRDEVRTLATELYKNESQHVDALRATIKMLGGRPVAQPELQYPTAFNSEHTFLSLANQFEDTGVSAYNGVAPMLQSKRILAAAGTIVQIEARHAALIRGVRGRPAAPHAFDKPSQPADVLAAVRTLFKQPPAVGKIFSP